MWLLRVVLRREGLSAVPLAVASLLGGAYQLSFGVVAEWNASTTALSTLPGGRSNGRFRQKSAVCALRSPTASWQSGVLLSSSFVHGTCKWLLQSCLHNGSFRQSFYHQSVHQRTSELSIAH